MAAERDRCFPLNFKTSDTTVVLAQLFGQFLECFACTIDVIVASYPFARNPAASRSIIALSVASQWNSGSSRPKCP